MAREAYKRRAKAPLSKKPEPRGSGFSTGSIYVPDTAKEKPQQAEVVAIGPGKVNEKTGERRPLDVKVGDKVIYAKYSGTEVKHAGQKYILIEQENVLAKLI